ncbi:MAG: amidohydrolase [Burkholderiales bacterium]|nr:amidohydrolase [Burkholderiales bacterium]
MIIDMRLRPPLESWKNTAQFTEGSGYYPSRMGFPRPPSVKSQSVDDLLQEMTEADILGVIMGRQAPRPLGIIPNDEITAVMQRHPGRFVAFAGIDLRDIEAGIEEIERTRRIEGYRGVSIEPGASFTPMHSDDKALYPLYERCQELELPLSITISGMLCTMVGNDLTYGSPTSVARVAKDFPKLKIVVSHGAWPAVMAMIEVAFMRENVYVSPDLYINGIDMPGSQEYIKAAKSFMPQRLLFGTAYPSRPLKESVAAFREWGLPPALEEAVLYRNAARLLKLE